MHNKNVEWLIHYKQSGFCFFNTKCRDKKVSTLWTQYQTRKQTDEEIRDWLRLPTQNYAIVCGEISDLIVIDVDTKNGADPTPFQNKGFYEVRTPSGGYHFYVKYDPSLANTKHTKQDGILKGVDLQSNGSLAFAPPSYFPKKGGYELVKKAPIIPIPEDLLLQILEELEPEKQAEDYTPFRAVQVPENGRPGDIFNALATWEDILYPQGWTKVGNAPKGVQYWRRPGKKEGISASTNWNGYDLFFPYTTSVDGLDQKKGYTKFSLLATLKYDGDFSRTAKELVIENYKIANQLI